MTRVNVFASGAEMHEHGVTANLVSKTVPWFQISVSLSGSLYSPLFSPLEPSAHRSPKRSSLIVCSDSLSRSMPRWNVPRKRWIADSAQEAACVHGERAVLRGEERRGGCEARRVH